MLSSGPGDASEWYWIVSNGSLRCAQALDRAVVEVHVAHLHAARQAVAVDRVAVVLRRDVHPAGRHVLAPGGWRRGGRTSACTSSAQRAMPVTWWPRQMPMIGVRPISPFTVSTT